MPTAIAQGSSNNPAAPGSSVRSYARDLCLCSDRKARELVPYNIAEKLRILPLALIDLKSREMLSVAAVNESDSELIASLRFLTGKDVRITACEPQALDLAIFMAYQGDDTTLERTVQAIKRNDLQVQSDQSALRLEFRHSEGAAGLLSALTDYAISKQASDLHLMPKNDGCHVKIRISAELRSAAKPVCSLALHAQVISRLKVLAGLDTTVRNLAQDGSFRVPLKDRSIDVRVNIMPTVHGEKAVLRFFGLDSVIELADLGFEPEALELLELFFTKQEGALLVAGPTGSGKSSTLYAIAHELSQRNLSCASIEDPVEVLLPGVAQTAINPKIGLDYADCLRSVLRQDPDCILLGEIRDKPSAEVALQAAITGHLLLSTVHARSIHEIILRLRHFKVDALTIAQALGLLVNQRLIPKLCASCKVLDLKTSQLLGKNVFQQVGCAECDYSGFCGQVLAFEMLWVDHNFAKRLAQGRIPQGSKEKCSAKGYFSMQACLEKLLGAGRISFKQYQSMLESR